jgi:hypothetical protein
MATAINYTPSNSVLHENTYSNQNTKNLNQQLEKIGKTDKPVLNRLRNFSFSSKSQNFLNKINEILNRIDPENPYNYKPDNFKKINKLLELIEQFILKKPNLLNKAKEIKNNILRMIEIFKTKEALIKVNLNNEIKNVLKKPIDIRGINIENETAKYKEKIMRLYNKFLDEYIKNYYQLVSNLQSSSNKKKSMDQIGLLNTVHHIFFDYYTYSINKKNPELVKKIDEINILIKYLNFLQSNKSKTIINNQNLSEELLKLSEKIYELANSLDLAIESNIYKYNTLKQMLGNLNLFIDSQINLSNRQMIQTNLKEKYNALNKKLQNVIVNLPKTLSKATFNSYLPNT